MAKQNDTGVYQKSNGYWEYRFRQKVNGKMVTHKKTTDAQGNKLKTKKEAVAAREAALVAARASSIDTAALPITRRTVKQVFEEFCEHGRKDRAYQTIRKQDSLFSELELSIIRARVRSGMRNAKEKGAKIGRRPTTKDDIPPIFYKHYPTFMAKQMNVSEFARVCGLSRPTIYKYIRLVS